jgi:hypothetical protein
MEENAWLSSSDNPVVSLPVLYLKKVEKRSSQPQKELTAEPLFYPRASE